MIEGQVGPVTSFDDKISLQLGLTSINMLKLHV